MKDSAVQRDLWTLLRTDDDPALMAECARMLCAIKDDVLIKEVLDLFGTCSPGPRKLALAEVLGSNWERREVQPVALDLIERGEPAYQERVLSRVCLQDHGIPRQQVCARLKTLVQTGATEGVRAAAAGALRGVDDPTDVQFLIDVMTRDASPAVQDAAMQALPCHYMSRSGSEWQDMVRRQTRAMYVVAIDSGRSLEFRKQCADGALFQVKSWERTVFLEEGEIAALRALLETDK